MIVKHALTIAGSDCSGGAGIQADLKTFAAHGIYGMSAIVSVVAENTCRVLDIQDITPDMIEKQIIAVFEDIEVHAVKVGMLSTRAGMLAVSKMLKQYRPKHVVIDPVMVAKGGCALMQEEALSTLIEEMIPLADVLTPNIPEAEAITGMKIQSEEERKRAAQTFATKRIPTKNTHGTGCTFSSAIASNLALGYAMPQAVANAKDYVTMAITHALEIGKGHGPTHHLYDVYQNGLTVKENEHEL